MRRCARPLGWLLVVLTALAPATAWCSTGACDRPAIDTGCCDQTTSGNDADRPCDDCLDLDDEAIPAPDRNAPHAVAILPAVPLTDPSLPRPTAQVAPRFPTGPPPPSGALRDLRTIRLLI